MGYTRNTFDFATVKYAHLYAAPTAGAKIAAAIVDLPAAGGTIDARGLTGTQTLPAALSINKPLLLMLGTVTLTYAGTGVAILATVDGVSIVGDSASQTIIENTSTTADGIQPKNRFFLDGVTVRGPGSGTGSGIDGAADDVQIQNSIIEGWGDHGINNGGTSNRWTVITCTFQNNLNNGILINGFDHKVLDCYSLTNGNWGIDCNGQRCLIRGNTVKGNGDGLGDSGGIVVYGYVSGATYNANENTVTFNTCYGNIGQGIFVSAGAGATANNNSVTLNHCNANTNDGISVGGGAGTYSGNKIYLNFCNGNGRYGIGLEPGSGTASENEVCRNRCRSNTNIGIVIQSGAADTVFEKNLAIGNGGQEIYEFGARTRRSGNIVTLSNTTTAEGGEVLVTAQFDKTNTTLANVTELTVTIFQQKKYRFRAQLFVDAAAAGGGKYAINCGLAAASIKYQVNAIDNATNAFVITSRQTALAGAAGQNGATALVVTIEGEITTAAGAESGALTVQFAQNVASGTSSVLTGSTFRVEQIPA